MNRNLFLYPLAAILFIISSAAFSQSNDGINRIDETGMKQGHWEKKYPNGQTRYSGQFFNNMPYGNFTYYFNNGKKKAEVNYLNEKGKASRSYTILYYKNGKKHSEGFYADKLKDSTWKYYHEDGSLLSKEEYSEGKKDGKWANYYFNGQISEEKSWKNDKKHGWWISYFTDGSLKSSITYKNDKREGSAVYFYPNRQKMLEGTFKDDKRTDEWKSYMDDGRLQKIKKYRDGFLINEVKYIDAETISEQDSLKTYLEEDQPSH